jgi:hypothetical protein
MVKTTDLDFLHPVVVYDEETVLQIHESPRTGLVRIG